MNLKKLFSIMILFYFIMIPTLSFADDYLEEDIPLLDTEIEASSELSKIPNINATHAVIFDRASKTVLFGKSENERCKMASTTKIMTAIVVIEHCNNLDDIVTVSKKAARNGWF